MSRSFTRASGHSLNATAGAVFGLPLTIAGWFNLASAGINQVLIDIANAASFNNAYRLALDTSNIPVMTTQVTALAFSSAVATAGFSGTGTWAHCCGIVASTTDRRSFFNGANKGTNAVSRSPSAPTAICIGDRVTNPATSTLDGLAAEVAIWSAALTDDEVLQLGRGMSPLLIRPESLFSYWPVYGNNDPEENVIAPLGLTNTGTTKSADHPRIIRPSRPRLILPGPPAVPQTVVPDPVDVTVTASDALIEAITVTPEAVTVYVLADDFRQLDIEVATVTVTAADASVGQTPVVFPDAATVTVTAVDASITLGSVSVAVEAATVTVTAADVTIVPSVAVLEATVTVTVADASVVLGAISVVPEVATVTVTAADAIPTQASSLAVDAATITVTAADAVVVLSGAATQSPDPAEVTVTVVDATVVTSGVAVVEVATAVVLVQAADVSINQQFITPDPAGVVIEVVGPDVVLSPTNYTDTLFRRRFS